MDTLIVEDDDMLNTVMSLQLTTAGLSVRSARTGAEALRKIEEQVPSVLILDVGLPDMTAHEMVAYLRNNPATSDIVLIIHTTLDLSTAEQALLTLGPTKFITKSTAFSFALTELVLNHSGEQSGIGSKK
ncbi:hypothetical protein BH10CYA1_BH10CYA1_29130 [soil metagenome]